MGREESANSANLLDNSEKDEKVSGADTVDLREVLQSRGMFYEMLASFFFMPLKQEQIDSLAQQDLSPYEQLNDYFADGINDITRYLRRRNTGTRQELAVDFTGAFAGTSAYEGKTAVPYKSVFTSASGLLYQEGYQEVSRAFRKEAVKRREGLDWPDDHLSFMFQFMALESRRASDALEKEDAPEALRLIELSRSFLKDNIASWYDTFMDLALKLISTRFYRGVLKITKGFIELDAQTLDDLADELKAQTGQNDQGDQAQPQEDERGA